MNENLPINPNLKYIIVAKKIVALSLIIFPLYHIYQSTIDLIFVFPKLSIIGDKQTVENIYIDLIKKAILISTGLFFDTFYGIRLLAKPGGATKIIHIVFGVILFIVSNFLFKLAAIDQVLSHIQFLPLT